MAAERLGDMTRDDLKSLVRELVQEVLWEWEQELPDPDEGLELRPEIAERLLKSQREKRPLKSLDEVKQRLGLDECSYALKFTDEAADDLERLDRAIADRILEKLEWLAVKAEDLFHRPLTGRWRGYYRLRIGDYRAIFRWIVPTA